MSRLLDYPVEEPQAVSELRKSDDVLGLAVALGRAGCGYEAAALLRPRKAMWRDQLWADEANTWLAAQTWWNKQGRDVAILRQQGKSNEAHDLLLVQCDYLWDYPPALMHLAQLSQGRRAFDLAAHLYRRIYFLFKRGVEGVNMVAYEYLVQANLISIQAEQGDAAGALAALQRLGYHTGNLHHYEMLEAELVALTGDEDQALRLVAQVLVHASERRGSTNPMRVEWAQTNPRLAKLRQRQDWDAMRQAPRVYLARQAKPGAFLGERDEGE